MLIFLTNLLAVSCLRPETPSLREPIFTSSRAPSSISDIPKDVSKQSLVTNVLRLADLDETKSFLTEMTSFPDRYFKSSNGVAAAEWIVRII
jgi:hypothetical protein